MDKVEYKSNEDKVLLEGIKLIITTNSTPNDYWKSVSELSGATGSTSERIIKLIDSSDEFVHSTKTNREGEELITTKELFNKNESFFNKLVGALKNRID